MGVRFVVLGKHYVNVDHIVKIEPLSKTLSNVVLVTGEIVVVKQPAPELAEICKGTYYA